MNEQEKRLASAACALVEAARIASGDDDDSRRLTAAAMAAALSVADYLGIGQGHWLARYEAVRKVAEGDRVAE